MCLGFQLPGQKLNAVKNLNVAAIAVRRNNHGKRSWICAYVCQCVHVCLHCLFSAQRHSARDIPQINYKLDESLNRELKEEKERLRKVREFRSNEQKNRNESSTRKRFVAARATSSESGYDANRYLTSNMHVSYRFVFLFLFFCLLTGILIRPVMMHCFRPFVRRCRL